MHPRIIAASTLLATALSATALASADAAPRHHATDSARAGGFSVTASVDNTEPLQGAKVKIKATVRPAAPGADVTLQVRYANRKSWKTIDHGRLSGASKVVFKDRVGSVRERLYRVVKPAADNRGAGQGTTPKVTVFGWRDLIRIPVATSRNMLQQTVFINGRRYAEGIRSDGIYPPSTTGSIEFNLNRSCKSFRATVGLEDSSPGAGGATIAVATDGTPRYSGTFALAQAAPVAFDVTKVFRLSIATSFTSNGVAAIGTPQVLCSF